MIQKIFWMIIELATIGMGTYRLVKTLLDEVSIDNEAAGFAAFLIVSGLLLRNWRTTLFASNNASDKAESTKKVDNLNRTINSVVMIIISVSVIALNRKINDAIDNNESEIKVITKSIEGRLSEFEEVDSKTEKRILNLERNSHYHNY